MIHDKRVYNVSDEADLAVLAEKLTQRSWTLCTAFRFEAEGRKLLFLNDSFSEDGAAEFAVVDEPAGLQVESVTFGWCTEEQAAGIIKRILATPAAEAPMTTAIAPRLEHIGPCTYCA